MNEINDGLKQKYKNEIIRALDYHFPQSKKLILFGSRATGTYKQGSDIDIAIDSGDPLPLWRNVSRSHYFGKSSNTL